MAVSAHQLVEEEPVVATPHLRLVSEDDELHPQRIRVEIDGHVMAQGSIANIQVIMRSLMDPEAIVYMHSSAVASFGFLSG